MFVHYSKKRKKRKKRSLVILVMSSHQATGNASRLPAVLLLTLLSFGKKKKSPKTLLYNIKLYARLVCLFSSILNHLKLHMCCRES